MRTALFSAGMNDAGLPVVRAEFPPDCDSHNAALALADIMDEMVGKFSSQAACSTHFHALFGSCEATIWASVEDGKKIIEVEFKQLPPRNCGLMELILGVDKTKAN